MARKPDTADEPFLRVLPSCHGPMCVLSWRVMDALEEMLEN